MILVLLGISIALIITGLILKKVFDEDWSWDVGPMFGIFMTGLIAFAITGISTIVIATEVRQAVYIDEKIEMYEEENTEIEGQIAVIVKDYMKHESEIFESIEPEDAMTYIAIIPELKSNTLVEKQMRVHTENNQKIRELKEARINAKNYKWWLYFGG